MAQVDPNIAMGYRPVQIPLEESPLNRLRERAEFENSLLRSQEIQRGMQQRNALARINATPGLEIGSPEYFNRVQQDAPDLIEDVLGRQLKRQQLQETKQTADIRQRTLEREQLKEAKKSLAGLKSLDQAYSDIFEGMQSGALTAEQGESLRAGLPTNETDFPAWKERTLLGYLTAEQQLDRQEKSLNTEYSDYLLATVTRNPDARILSKAEFSARRGQPAAAAAAPAAAPDAAAPDVAAAAAAPAEDSGLDGMTVSAEGTLLAPGVAELYSSGDPRLKNIADAMQRRFEDRAKSQRFTGDFRNVELARQEIARLRKLPQTPEITAQIAGLDRMIGGAEKGRGTTLNVGLSTEKKYGEQFAGNVAKADVELKDAAERAPEAANTANRILGLLQSGQVITGSAANIKLQMSKFLRLGGGSDSEAITNTEVLLSSLADSTLGAIKSSGLGSGQGFTDKDREFLERAKAGQLTYEAASLRRLAELAHKAAAATAGKWNKRSKTIPKSALEGTGINTENIEVSPLYKSGGEGKTPPAAPAPYSDAEKERRYQEYKAKQGGK
jgi:hypothetical protein